MKYVLTIMMRGGMVKLNLIEIKIRDLQFFLHFLFFCCAGRLHSNLIEIKKKIYWQGFGCSCMYVSTLYSELIHCLD